MTARDLLGPRLRDISDLRLGQFNALRHVEDNPSALVVGGVGSGKTIIGLTAITRVGARRTLVVGPRLVAATVWHVEALQWYHTQHLRFSHVQGTARQRGQALNRDADVYLVSYDNLKWLQETAGLESFDFVIWDEVAAMKNISSRRFAKLRRWIPKVPRRLGLTADPAPNALEDLFAISYCCDGGHRFGRVFTDWREKWFTQDYMGYNWEPRPGAQAALTAAMRDMTAVVPAYTELPDLEVLDVPVTLPERSRALYDAMTQDNVITLDNGVTIVAESEGVVQQKQRQIAQGFVYEQDEVTREKTGHPIHNAKLEALRRVVWPARQCPLIIGYNYTVDKEVLKYNFPQAVELDADVVGPWNAGEIDVLLVHPMSGAHGLNLQFGGFEMVFYGLNWSLQQYVQLIGRLRRSGQVSPVVRVWRLIALGTVDEDLIESLAEKESRQDAVKEALS